MQLTAITSLRRVEKLVEQFRDRLRSIETEDERKVGNPSSTSICTVDIHRDHGFWVVLDDRSIDTQTWHVFGLINDRLDTPDSTLEHVCQINFSYEGDVGRVGGLFAQDQRGNIYITHSGGVGGGRAGIGKNAFLDFLAERTHDLVPVEVDVARAPPTQRLVLCDLDDPLLPQKIARFVRLVADFKATVRGQPLPSWPPVTQSVPPTGQGRQQSPEIRRAVERHAMDRVERHYRTQGYSVERVTTQPGELDLRCLRRGRELRVEVKGTTSAGDSVELTAAEVRYAAKGNPPVHLAVVSSIQVDSDRSPPLASGGELYIYESFTPSDHTLTPTKFRCTLDHSRGKYA